MLFFLYCFYHGQLPVPLNCVSSSLLGSSSGLSFSSATRLLLLSLLFPLFKSLHLPSLSMPPLIPSLLLLLSSSTSITFPLFQVFLLFFVSSLIIFFSKFTFLFLPLCCYLLASFVCSFQPFFPHPPSWHAHHLHSQRSVTFVLFV